MLKQELNLNKFVIEIINSLTYNIALNLYVLSSNMKHYMYMIYIVHV